MSFFREAYYDKHEQERLRDERRIEALREARRRGLTSLHETGGFKGVSHAVLDDQIEQKKQRFLEEQESRVVDSLDEKSLIDRVTIMSDETERLKRQKAMEYRRELEAQMANSHMRTTYDLENKGTQRGGTARSAHGDDTLGPSSMQVFEGEDPYRSERERLMKEQRRIWAQQQMEEKKRQDDLKKQERLHYATEVSGINQMASQMEEESRRTLRERRLAIDRENLRAMEERKEQQRQEKLRDKEYDRITLETLNAPGVGMNLLAESLQDGQSTRDPRRYRPDHYRGRPRDELQTLASENVNAIRTKHEQQVQEIQEEQEFADREAILLRRARQLERETENLQRMRAKEVKNVLLEQAASASARKEEEKNYRKHISIGEEFFGNFGISDR